MRIIRLEHHIPDLPSSDEPELTVYINSSKIRQGKQKVLVGFKYVDCMSNYMKLKNSY